MRKDEPTSDATHSSWGQRLALGLVFGYISLFTEVTAAEPLRLIRVVGAENVALATAHSAVQMAPALPGTKKLARTLAAHVGQPTTEENLGLLADLVVDHLKQHDWPISLVTVWDEDDSLAKAKSPYKSSKAAWATSPSPVVASVANWPWPDGFNP